MAVCHLRRVAFYGELPSTARAHKTLAAGGLFLFGQSVWSGARADRFNGQRAATSGDGYETAVVVGVIVDEPEAGLAEALPLPIGKLGTFSKLWRGAEV